MNAGPHSHFEIDPGKEVYATGIKISPEQLAALIDDPTEDMCDDYREKFGVPRNSVIRDSDGQFFLLVSKQEYVDLLNSEES